MMPMIKVREAKNEIRACLQTHHSSLFHKFWLVFLQNFLQYARYSSKILPESRSKFLKNRAVMSLKTGSSLKCLFCVSVLSLFSTTCRKYSAFLGKKIRVTIMQVANETHAIIHIIKDEIPFKSSVSKKPIRIPITKDESARS